MIRLDWDPELSFLDSGQVEQMVTINNSVTFYGIAYPSNSFVPIVKRKRFVRGIRKIPFFWEVILAVQK